MSNNTKHFDENEKLPVNDPNFRSQAPAFRGHVDGNTAEVERVYRMSDPAYVNQLRKNMGLPPL